MKTRTPVLLAALTIVAAPALVACGGGPAASTSPPASATATEWPGHPLITANGAHTTIGTERVYHDTVSVLCSGSTASPTMTVTGPEGWKATSSQPGASGGPARVSVTSPTGQEATFESSELVWTADHRLNGGGDSVTVPGESEEWDFYTDGLTC